MNLNDIYLILSIILILLNIVQYFRNRDDKNILKNLARSWQNHAEGLKNALLNIAYSNKYTNKEDVKAAVEAVAQSAVGLDKALVEQRFNTDDEVKKLREKTARQTKQFFNSFRKPS